MSSFIVSQRKDGRGGFHPFNSYGKEQAGAMVRMGDKDYKVTSDGRVNIPKAIFDEYGIEGKDGRKRIEMRFSSAELMKGGWKKVSAIVSKPLAEYKNAKTGLESKKPRLSRKVRLEPDDVTEYTWS